MSNRQTKARSPETKQQAPTAYYLYCIGEAEALLPLFETKLPVAIESDGGVEVVARDDLAAVVSRVELIDYGEKELQAHLADSTWTAVRAMRHEKVVEHFAARASVIPLRFGAIYLERSGVAEMLDARREEFREAIRQLQGREEWGVNVYLDSAKFIDQITSVSAHLRELEERAEAASPGQSYLIRKKIDALRRDEAQSERKRIGLRIEETLAAQSEGSTRVRVLKDEATEHGALAFKYAFLVDRNRFSEFRSNAEQLAQEYQALGFQIELTGPWPAYNFANPKNNG